MTHSLEKIQKSAAWVKRLAKSRFHSVGNGLYRWNQDAGSQWLGSLAEIRENAEWVRELACRRYRSAGTDLYREKPHGVRRCSTCRTQKGYPLFCHRDLNAARNIFDIYLLLASGKSRPQAFEHEKDEV